MFSGKLVEARTGRSTSVSSFLPIQTDKASTLPPVAVDGSCQGCLRHSHDSARTDTNKPERTLGGSIRSSAKTARIAA